MTHSKEDKTDKVENNAGPLAVVAIGGNSLISETEEVSVASEYRIVGQTCRQIAALISEGWRVIITHGNGPQAGFNLRRCELSTHELFELPLDVIVTFTQGSIGYYIQQNLFNIFARKGMAKQITTIVTQVEVDPEDPAFKNPTKPIGGYHNHQRATELQNLGWPVKEESGKGWRRMMASPRPLRIIEENIIGDLLTAGHIIVACGGGGVPVTLDDQGKLKGVAAIIDKDFTSALLARNLGAELLIISTAVEQVAINLGQPTQQWLDQMTIQDAQRYSVEGHFPPGNMGPKIEAAVDFIQNWGKRAIITNPPNIYEAVSANKGTHITPVMATPRA